MWGTSLVSPGWLVLGLVVGTAIVQTLTTRQHNVVTCSLESQLNIDILLIKFGIRELQKSMALLSILAALIFKEEQGCLEIRPCFRCSIS